MKHTLFILAALVVLVGCTTNSCDPSATQCFAPSLPASGHVPDLDRGKPQTYVFYSPVEYREYQKYMKRLKLYKKQVKVRCDQGDQYYCSLFKDLNKR